MIASGPVVRVVVGILCTGLVPRGTGNEANSTHTDLGEQTAIKDLNCIQRIYGLLGTPADLGKKNLQI